MKTSDVKSLAKELRPHIEADIDRADILKGMAAAAREKGIDWAQLKKLVKAQVQDEREGVTKRVDAIVEKADFAAAYADMLGLMNKNEKTCSSSDGARADTAKPAEKILPIVPRDTATPEIAPAVASGEDLGIPEFLRRTA